MWANQFVVRGGTKQLLIEKLGFVHIIPPNWGVSYHFDWHANRSRLPSRTIYRVPIKFIWQAPTRWYYLHKLSFVRYVTITNMISFLSLRRCDSKAVGTIFGLGGQKKFCRAKFFLIILFFKRIQFCSLVYLGFPISTDLLTYFGHISIHWSICRCFYNLEFFGLPKYWGGNCPPCPPCSYGHGQCILANLVIETIEVCASC